MARGSFRERSIGVTAFKSRCLSLVDDVARGKTSRIVLTRRNKPVAAIVRIPEGTVELWGAMKGSVRVAPGVDLTQGVGEEWDADG